MTSQPPTKATPILDAVLNDLAREIEMERSVQPGDAIKIQVSFIGPPCANDPGDYRSECDPPFGWCVLKTGTRREAAAILRQYGWRFHKGYWYCPFCVSDARVGEKREIAPDEFYTPKTGYQYRKFGNKREWERIKREQNYACLHCGRSEPEITLTRDHIDPNGPNTADNIQALCGPCNSRKTRRSNRTQS